MDGMDAADHGLLFRHCGDLVGMTVWEVVQPTVERKGFLPISTTRGDRLFIGLLSAAYLHLMVVGFTPLSIWWALAGSVLWLLVLIRWG